MESTPTLLKSEGRVLATLEADGRRRWLSPKVAAGRFLTARRWVGFALIAIFVTIPFIEFNGKPLVLMNVVKREFTFIGYTFLPRDTFLLALLAVSVGLSIFAFTALLGRVWCGWGCPQTVYMEHVFRPVERFFLGRRGVGGKPKEGLSAWRYVGMYATFLVLSIILAHVFLSYFVGVEELKIWVTRSPINHPWSFFVIFMVTGAMMFDFCYFREQTCLIACPYGRFQSVLLDKNSLTIRYDRTRGEPRGKGAKKVSLPVVEGTSGAARTNGDCVDCTMCVQVCPTGIDIRDGVQIECIGCAQCIDACNTVMDRIGKPQGLIRYSSLAAMQGEKTRIIRPRLVLYAVVITALLTFLGIQIATKSPVDVLMVRNQGLPFVMSTDGLAENTAKVQITNRTEKAVEYRIVLVGETQVKLLEEGETLTLEPRGVTQKPVHFLADPSVFVAGKHTVRVRVEGSDGAKVERTMQLFGPNQAAASNR